MKYLVIYNPYAANGVAAKKVDGVKQHLENLALDYTIEFTERPGHAVEIATGAADKYDVLVAAGGDGTANEVLSGIMRYKAGAGASIPAFGVLCVGRGNDFAYGAGIPGDFADGCTALQENKRKWIDVGSISGPVVAETRYFGNGVGMGFDTIVGLEAAKITWAQGFLGYLLGALKTMFFFYNPPLLSIKTDTLDETRPMLQISVMNGRRMGGAFFMAPEAAIDDGLFDLCIAGEPKRGVMLGLIVKFLKGSQEGDPHIVFSRSKKVIVTSTDKKLVVHADGETICTEGAQIELEIIPHAVEVIYGEK
jgi:diacylglycerol kinase (ATP)